MKTLLVAAVALVDRDGRVLLAQRPDGAVMRDLAERHEVGLDAETERERFAFYTKHFGVREE